VRVSLPARPAASFTQNVDPEKLTTILQGWQQKYGYASCESVFDRYLLLYQPLTTAEIQYLSETEHRRIGATVRFFVRIEPQNDQVTIELHLGTETLASYGLSNARGAVDAETIYSYFVLERPELKNHAGIKEKFSNTCEFFLDLFRTN
jgi:hypothetical protein